LIALAVLPWSFTVIHGSSAGIHQQTPFKIKPGCASVDSSLQGQLVFTCKKDLGIFVYTVLPHYLSKLCTLKYLSLSQAVLKAHNTGSWYPVEKILFWKVEIRSLFCVFQSGKTKPFF